MHSIEDQLILHEGLKTDLYKCPANKWTIGVGRNLEDRGLTADEQQAILDESGLTKEQVIERLRSRGVSREEALLLLRNDIKSIANALTLKYTWFTSLDEVRRKVCIDMAFNLGLGGFSKFKNMIRALAAKDYQKAAREMENSVWYRQVGDRAKRLVRMMRTGQDY